MSKYLMAGVLLLVVASNTFAATVLTNGTNATGIKGLDINGVFYDVSFQFIIGTETDPIDSFGPGDIFQDNPAGAETIVNVMGTLLADAGVTSVGTGFSGNGSSNFAVFYQIGRGCQDLCAWRGARSGSFWVPVDSDVDSLSSIEVAVFMPAVGTVPVPPALYLFGSGLLLLARRARCRRNSFIDHSGIESG